MAITKEYIGTHYSAEFLCWLREKLVPDYVDSIEESEDGTAYLLFRDGKAFAKMTTTVWQLYADPTRTTTVSSVTANTCQVYGYTTRCGVALQYGGIGGAGNSLHGVLLFTHDNSGNTVVVMPNKLSDSSSTSTAYTLSTTAYIVRFVSTGAEIATTMQLRYNQQNVCCIVPFCVSTLDGSSVYTPDAFWCAMYQFSEAGKLRIGDTMYLSFGPWLLRDE